METIDGCKGCLSLSKIYNECIFTKRNITNMPDCPCMNCILKTICSEDCNDFINTRIKNKKIIMVF